MSSQAVLGDKTNGAASVQSGDANFKSDTSQTNETPKIDGTGLSSEPSSSIDPCASAIFREAQRAVRKHGGQRRQPADVTLILNETQNALKKKNSPCLKTVDDNVIRALSIAGMLAPMDKDSLVKERAGFVMKNQNIIGDVIFDYSEMRLKFAVWNGRKMKLHPVYPINANDEGAGHFVPPTDRFDTAERKIILLPTGVRHYGSTAQLVEKMKRFIRDYYQAPDIWIEIMTYYALMTWVPEAFSAVPYLRWLGEPETGKTRGLEVTSLLSYRATSLSGASSVPPMFRLAEKWQGTLVIDESDFAKQTDISEALTKILNNGYARNKPVFRSDGRDNEPRPFDVFGPKILSTRQPFEDAATESRCITFPTQEVDVSLDIPLQVQEQFQNRAQELRNELLQWRFDNLHKIRVEEKELREKFGNRLAQIGSALLAVVEDEGARQRIIEFLSATGVQEKQNRAAAIVLEGLSRIEEFDPTDAGDGCKLRADGIVLLKHVACFANEAARDFGGLTEKNPGSGIYVSINEIKGILRSLDFKVKREKHGNVVHIDTAHLNKMRAKYALNEPTKNEPVRDGSTSM